MRRLLRWAAVAIAALLAVPILVAMTEPPAPVTTAEFMLPGEEDADMRLVRQAQAAIAEHALPDRFFKRDAHAKPHGCVTAWLDVDPDLDARFRAGVFARPGWRYLAWVRFSNGTQPDDRTADARGMAIKLMDVDGPKLLTKQAEPRTQDFVMINYHTFFLRDVFEYERFFAFQAADRPFAYFVGWNPFRWQLRELWHATHMMYQRVPSPLATRYYSMSAYRLGGANVKFSAVPCRDQPSGTPPTSRGPNYLREALVAGLRAGDACFDFLVQAQDPQKEMPIEDPSVEWREADVPYVRIARLEIPRQEFDSDAQNRFCENLSFSPWHTLEDHRPLGNLNRARRAVYQGVSTRRHVRNAASAGEPHGWCLDLSGAPCPS